MRLPPTAIKTLRLLAALALAAGGVWLLRFAARDLLRPMPPPPAGAPEELVSAPAPKLIDLTTVVPQALWTTFGGLAPERTEETLPMPVEQARAEVAARLAAKGWHPLSGELPLDQAQLLTLAGGEVYATPDQAFAHVTVTTDKAGFSRVRTFLLRTEGAEPIDPAAPPDADGLSLLVQSAARLRPERQLPRWMAAPCLGSALTTQLIQRRGGTAFYLTALVPGTPAETLARVGEAAAAAGWVREHSPIDALRPAGAPAPAAVATFVYRNVACNVRAVAGPRAGETTLVYRFTDDEVYVRPPRKEKP